MTNKLIIQIGRLDSRYREKIKFSYQNKEGEAELSSKFLLTTKEFNDAKLLLIFPQSIIFQNNLISNKELLEKDKFIKEIQNIETKDYLDDSYSLIKKHPHLSDGIDFLVVDSLGNYNFKNDLVELESTLNIITLQIYSYLIANYSNNEFDNLNIDISSGHNIYISSLLSTLYRFLPFVKFRRYLSEDQKNISAFILNSDPIIPGNDSIIKIQKSEFKARAFNSFTYKDSFAACQLVKTIFKEQSYYKELYEYIDNQYFILHGSFIYGIPMMLMLSNYDNLKFLYETIGLDRILNDLFKFTTTKGVYGESLNDALFYSITYAFALGEFVFKNFQEIIKNKVITFDISEKHSSFRNVKLNNAHELLHELYGQPVSNYLNEIKLIFEEFNRIDNKSINQFISAANIRKLYNPNYKIINNFNPRNYFAHLGCELNCFEIKIEKNNLLVRYNDFINVKSILKYIKK